MQLPSIAATTIGSFEGIDLEHEAVKTIYRRREQPRPVPSCMRRFTALSII